MFLFMHRMRPLGTLLAVLLCALERNRCMQYSAWFMLDI